MPFKKRPLVKDMSGYFFDHFNWTPVWNDPTVDLRIERLKHTKITRLVHVGVVSAYIGQHDVVLLYSLNHKPEELLGEYMTSRPNQSEIQEAIKHQWTEDEK